LQAKRGRDGIAASSQRTFTEGAKLLGSSPVPGDKSANISADSGAFIGGSGGGELLNLFECPNFALPRFARSHFQAASESPRRTFAGMGCAIISRVDLAFDAGQFFSLCRGEFPGFFEGQLIKFPGPEF
jgi:hypothetical protein